MSYNIIILLFIILIIYLCYSYLRELSEITYVKSNIDNNTYIIRSGHNRSKEWLQESANTLARINQRMEKLIIYLDTKYKNDDTRTYFISKLKQNYNSYMISEAAIDPKYTTYTVDKSDMHICLRTRNSSEEIYDINTLMYVVLHEAAHLANYSKNGNAIIGHGLEFKNIFAFLVKNAIELGIYNYIDYNNIPQEYCGIMINSTII
jgi:hypothetical protein